MEGKKEKRPFVVFLGEMTPGATRGQRAAAAENPRVGAPRGLNVNMRGGCRDARVRRDRAATRTRWGTSRHPEAGPWWTVRRPRAWHVPNTSLSGAQWPLGGRAIPASTHRAPGDTGSQSHHKGQSASSALSAFHAHSLALGGEGDQTS